MAEKNKEYDEQIAKLNHHDITDRQKKALRFLVDKVVSEDSWVRKQQIKMWKKNDEFWHGIQYIFWSESKQDWVSPVETRWFDQEEGREESEGPFYDFVFNIFKAHGESIIAALSSQIPAIRFPPDDAENADDLATAKTFDKIADLIGRHNKSKILLLNALLKLWNQGIVFAYHAPQTDEAFGKIMIPKYSDGMSCSKCGIPSLAPDTDESLSQEATDGAENLLGSPTPPADKNICPDCGEPMNKVPIITGFDETPKTRVIVDLFSSLEVKVSYYAKKQKDFGYLVLARDLPKAFLKSKFKHIKEDIGKDWGEAGQYERLARTPSSYSSYSRVDENTDLGTLQEIWLRPWMCEALPDDVFEDEKKWFEEEFPDGCKATYIGNTYAGSRNENMDQFWTVGKAGLSQFIHADALGQPLIPIQELSNIILNLTAETVEQGIPATFADSDVLNFNVYSRQEARPGFIYPVRPKTPGSSIQQSFYEQSRATLSKEVPLFWDRLDKLGQFVVGSFPSLFGGPGEGKSRTAAEYNMSRQMALQRLSIAWSMLTDFWANLMDKCVHLYTENMVDDEKFTKKDSTTQNWVSVWIRRTEMTGKVGEVEVEGSETFPTTMPQKQHMFMEILKMNNQFLNAAAFDSNNRSVVADILGFPDFEIPGRDQQIKQMREIQFILKNKTPVIPEPLVDDDVVHANVLRHYMVSPQGLDIEETDPEVYQLLMAHLQAHVQSEAQKTQQQFAQSPPGQSPEANPQVE